MIGGSLDPPRQMQKGAANLGKDRRGRGPWGSLSGVHQEPKLLEDLVASASKLIGSTRRLVSETCTRFYDAR